MAKDLQKKIGVSLLVLASLVVLYLIQDYLIPFLLAYILAYIVDPIVDFIQGPCRIKNRALAVWVFLLLFVGCFVGLVMAVIPSLIGEFQVVKSWAEQEGLFGKTEFWFLQEIKPLVDQVLQESKQNDMLSLAGSSSFGDGILSFLKSLFSTLGGLLGGVFSVFTFLLYFFFILVSFDGWSERLPMLIPESIRETFLSFFHELEDQMRRYFRGQSQVVLIVAILFSIGFKITGLPLAFAVGILAGLLNYVPYLQLVIIIPLIWLSGIQAIETGGDFTWVLAANVSVVVIIQLIQESILNPRILGKSVGLHPAIILLSLTVFGGLMGVIGMILAIPLTSLIIIYYKRLLKKVETKD